MVRLTWSSSLNRNQKRRGWKLGGFDGLCVLSLSLSLSLSLMITRQQGGFISTKPEPYTSKKQDSSTRNDDLQL